MAELPFAFVGQEYTSENPYQDRQVLVNWFVEIDPNDSAKEPKTLLGAPGLVQVATVYPLSSGVWSADAAFITADSTKATADGHISA